MSVLFFPYFSLSCLISSFLLLFWSSSMDTPKHNVIRQIGKNKESRWDSSHLFHSFSYCSSSCSFCFSSPHFLLLLASTFFILLFSLWINITRDETIIITTRRIIVIMGIILWFLLSDVIIVKYPGSKWGNNTTSKLLNPEDDVRMSQFMKQIFTCWCHLTQSDPFYFLSFMDFSSRIHGKSL